MFDLAYLTAILISVYVYPNHCANLPLLDPSVARINDTAPSTSITNDPRRIADPTCFCLRELTGARGLRSPVVMVTAGDGSDRIYVAEQVGVVWIFYPDGRRLNTPFLDITDRVVTSSGYDERGFLALAFHPGYGRRVGAAPVGAAPVERRVYAYYSTTRDGDDYTRLVEYRADDMKVKVETERVLMEFAQPFRNHNGGELIFGDDGFLYLMTGDGGSAGDPYDAALNKRSFLGKVLRIDIEKTMDGRPYGIPPDNPFLSDPNALPEIYAYGLRNPWRATKDAGDRSTGEGKGRIIIADVGQDLWEEIDILEKGGNYAWAAREGPQCYKPDMCGKIGAEVWPIHLYNHTVGACIIGGHVYRGAQSKAMQGRYFFSDWSTGKVFRAVEVKGQHEWDARQIHTCASSVCSAANLTTTFEPYMTSWGTDNNGEIYMLTTETGFNPKASAGAIYKIVDPHSINKTF